MASGAEEFKAFEAAGWSRRADTYARVTGAITARFVDALLDAACVGAGMRVLDVATGPGHVAAAVERLLIVLSVAERTPPLLAMNDLTTPRRRSSGPLPPLAGGAGDDRHDPCDRR